MDNNLINNIKSILMESVGQSIIADAISKKRVCIINYQGDKNNARGKRTIEPYVLGRIKGSHAMALRAFQLEGDTSSSVPNWKVFLLKNIISFDETNKTFNTQPSERGYNVGDYNEDGDKLFSSVRLQVLFDNPIKHNIRNTDNKDTFESPLEKVKQKRNNNIIQKTNNNNNINNNIPSVGPITNKNSITNDEEFKNLINKAKEDYKNNKEEYSLDNNDYDKLEVTKDQLSRNLLDYQKRKEKRLNKNKENGY